MHTIRRTLTLTVGAPNNGHMNQRRPTPSELIDLLGGTVEVARMLGIRAPSVTGWRTAGIPEARLIKIAVRLHQQGAAWNRFSLFPNDWHQIWPELVGSDGAPAVPVGVADTA